MNFCKSLYLAATLESTKGFYFLPSQPKADPHFFVLKLHFQPNKDYFSVYTRIAHEVIRDERGLLVEILHLFSQEIRQIYS